MIFLAVFALLSVAVNALPFTGSAHEKRAGVFTVPLARRQLNEGNDLHKRQTTLGFGDNWDNQYTIEMTLGNTSTVLGFDTGSSDIWTISSQCHTANCNETAAVLPIYDPAAFKSLGIPYRSSYGTSAHSTVSSGSVGVDRAAFGPMTNPAQVFASVNTTTSINRAQYTGLFGSGFPFLSESVREIFGRVRKNELVFDYLHQNSSREDVFRASGQLIVHAILDGQLESPVMTVSMQREVNVPGSGNAGQVTFGGFPEGLNNDSFTWIPVRLYDTSAGLISYRWETMLDDFIVNGKSIGKPAGNDSWGVSALFDTGAGALVLPKVALGEFDLENTHPCARADFIEVVLGNVTFPINPIDLHGPENSQSHSSGACSPIMAVADEPNPYARYSYILGTPFLKNVITAFYYGNLTDPLSDPPRIGLISTTTRQQSVQMNKWLFPSGEAGAPAISLVSPSAILPPRTTLENANPISAGTATFQWASATTGPVAAASTTSGTVTLTLFSHLTIFLAVAASVFLLL